MIESTRELIDLKECCWSSVLDLGPTARDTWPKSAQEDCSRLPEKGKLGAFSILGGFDGHA